MTEVKPTLLLAANVPYEPPRWAIAPYVQRGKGLMVQGDNGSGKTAYVCAIAAHETTGLPILGMEIQAPGNVLILSVEDDLPVLRGRIEASGGDLTRCYFLTNAAGLTFTSPEVEDAIRVTQCKLIIFDPIQAFLCTGLTDAAIYKAFRIGDLHGQKDQHGRWNAEPGAVYQFAMR